MSPLAVVPLAATLPLADSDAGKGSPIGLFVVLVLVVATYLLYRSMSGHLRKLPDRFPGYRTGEPDGTGPAAESAPPAGSADGAAGSADGVAGSTDGAAGSAAQPAGAVTDPAARPGNPAGEAGERPGPS